MRTSVIAVTLLIFARTAAVAADVWVDDDCTGPGNGSEALPYCTIQEAICAIRTTGGGTVHVEPGLYAESLRMFPGVSVVSTGGAAVTTIDATDQLCTTAQCLALSPEVAPRCAAVVWGSGSHNDDRLEGFRITGGAGLPRTFADGGTAQVGAGIFVYNSSPTITHNVIADNLLFSKTTHNFWGGGIYVGGGSYSNPTYPVITHNVIERNSATPTVGAATATVTGSDALGGGIYVGLFTAPTITDNVIRDNVAGDLFTELGVGGGIAVYSISPSRQPQISRNVIEGNVSTDLGGGLFFGQVWDADDEVPVKALVSSNLIVRNASGAGGGVQTNTTIAELYNNTIVDNVAEGGGGISFYNSASYEPIVVNNVVAYNTATQDGGGGIAFYTTPDVVSTNDVFGNSPDQIGGEYLDADYIGIDGNVSLAPLFKDRSPETLDLTPAPGSPLIDGGGGLATSATDLVGTPRVLDGDGDGVAIVDLGALEYAPDGDADGIPDYDDNCPAAENTGQADLDGDGAGDACDLCPADPDDDDGDDDGVCDDDDLCPTVADPQQDDHDGDSLGDACDPDDDDDGVLDDTDTDPTDPLACMDVDGDECDDCSSGNNDPASDGPDFDNDGTCDVGDRDDDDDGVVDPLDSNPHDPLTCADADADGCDDCSRGVHDPADDGVDFDLDGLCDGGDPDDDNDGTGDDQDCADRAPGVTTQPGSVGASLRFGEPDSARWKRGPQAMVYNLYRGTLAPGSGFAWTVSCAAAEVTTASADTRDVPPSGTAFFYVVGARNTCGDGPLRDDAGASRPFDPAVCGATGGDSDADGIPDVADNCPDMPGADPHDRDRDGRGDRCDPCPWGERPDGTCVPQPAGGSRDRRDRPSPDDDDRTEIARPDGR